MARWSYAQLRAEIKDLNNHVALLQGIIVGEKHAEVKPFHHKELTVQQSELIGILLSKYPRFIEKYSILDLLTTKRESIEDRGIRLVDAQILNIRKKFGKDAIVTHYGMGVALGKPLYDRLLEGTIT